MTTSPTIGSIMLSTTAPQQLVDWYTQVLPPTAEFGQGTYRFLEYPNITLMIDHRTDGAVDAALPAAPSVKIIMNFHVADARAVEKRLADLDWIWVAPLEDRAGDLFGTVADPEGNLVQIIQFAYEGPVS